MLLCWTDDAWADYLYWQSQDRRTLKRVNTLIRDMQITPEILRKLVEGLR